MFGVVFIKNLDLRRLLTDYGFEGFPGRKNFSLVGYKELVYSEELGSVIYDKLRLTQKYRNFSLKNSWNICVKTHNDCILFI
jgi:NADH-quinone oxidoreductase subunit C